MGEILKERKERSSIGELISVTINNGVVKADSLERKDNSSSDKSNYKVVCKGDIAYNSMRMWQGASGYSPYNGILSPAYTVLIPTEKVDSKFISYMFKKEKMLQQFQKYSQGLTSDTWNLKYPMLKDIPVLFPKIDEQVSIRKHLDNISSLIALHQRKLEHLQEQKKGLLQKMFPKNGEVVPEVRFPGFTDAWEQRKLGEVAEIVGGGTPSTKVKEYWDGDINWYSPVEIGNSIYASGSVKRITKLGLEKSSAKILPKGTVLFTSRAGIGNTAILSKEAATNQGFQSIVPKKKLLDSYFIFTETPFLKKYGEINGAGSTFVEVSGKQMAKMPLRLPLLEEQKKIGVFFKQIDSLIALHQRKLDHLELMKKGLLQQMFV